MPTSKQIHKKALKRKKIVAGKKAVQEGKNRQVKNWMAGKKKVKKVKKERKVLKPYSYD